MFSLNATGAPFRVTDWNSGPRPRTLTNCPSPTSRSMATPGTRCRASARLAAGSSPMRPAETASMMASARRFWSSESSIPATKAAVIVTSSRSTGASGAGATRGLAVAASAQTRTEAWSAIS